MRVLQVSKLDETGVCFLLPSVKWIILRPCAACGIILFPTCSQADLCLVNGAEDSAVTRWVGWPLVEVTPDRDLYTWIVGLK